MRTCVPVCLIALLLGLPACSRRSENRPPDNSQDDHSAARQAGRAAYNLTQESKKLAKKAGQELREATHEAHEGWKDARQNAKSKENH